MKLERLYPQVVETTKAQQAALNEQRRSVEAHRGALVDAMSGLNPEQIMSAVTLHLVSRYGGKAAHHHLVEAERVAWAEIKAEEV